jgi:iron complex outermembrane receptor protein
VTRSADRICNSQGEADGGAVGGSVFLDHGYLGASLSTFGSVYGAVAEDEVTIRMRNERFALEGEMRELRGWFSSVKGRVGHGRYRHTEFDAGVAGTVFRNDGGDLRLEGRHRAIGGLEGVIGVQAENNRFSAEGSEAFAPPSRTRQAALFAYEELPVAWGKFTFGARAEQVTVASLGSAATPRFGAAERKFHPGSAAIGALWHAAPAWQVTGNLAHSQRAPKDYELFANGPHVATGAYEVGNPDLGKERSTHAEVGLQWKRDANLFRVNAYQARFSNYVALLGTGGSRDADGNGAGGGVTDCGDGTSLESGCAAEIFSEFAYTPVRARFTGLEANGVVRVLPGARTVDVEWRADVVRAQNLTIGQPLPRISPARVGATLVGSSGPWSARLGFDHHARQDRVPVGDAPTAGFTLWHAALSYRVKAGAANLLWFARLDNATDRLAYSATSILTQSAPGRVPLPGRSVKVGVQATF